MHKKNWRAQVKILDVFLNDIMRKASGEYTLSTPYIGLSTWMRNKKIYQVFCTSEAVFCIVTVPSFSHFWGNLLYRYIGSKVVENYFWNIYLERD